MKTGYIIKEGSVSSGYIYYGLFETEVKALEIVTVMKRQITNPHTRRYFTHDIIPVNIECEITSDMVYNIDLRLKTVKVDNFKTEFTVVKSPTNGLPHEYYCLMWLFTMEQSDIKNYIKVGKKYD